jgi:hypothetical protein
MTIWVGQGQSHLPADIPGITTALGRRGQLRLKGQLRQQPAGDFIHRGPSQRRRQNSSNGRFAKSGVALTRSTEAGDRHDASHARPPPSNGQDPPPRMDLRQWRRHMLSRYRSRGQRHFIKLPAPRQRARGRWGPRQDRCHGGAGSRAGGHLTCNQAPAYIRAPGPLD